MNQAKFYNPLQIELMDSANALQLQGSSSSSIWSPQQLTQSDINSSIYFSPGLVRRALVKKSSSSTSTNSSSLFSWPMSSSSSQPREVTDNHPPVKPFNRGSQTPTLPRRSEKIDLSDVIANAQLQRSLGAPPKNCSFCRSNGEPEHIYTSHFLKDARDKITCPILMRYNCPICGATGEKAHTINYCRANNKKRNEKLAFLTSTKPMCN